PSPVFPLLYPPLLQSTFFPYTTLFRSCLRMRNVALTRIGHAQCAMNKEFNGRVRGLVNRADLLKIQFSRQHNLREANIREELRLDRKSTRLNSSHVSISYAVFCLKKKK